MHDLSKVISTLSSNFVEYNFGTFNPSLNSIQTQNKALKLIEQRSKGGRIMLTSRGITVAKKIWNGSNSDEQRLVCETKKFFNEMNYWELIVFSYSTYPETTVNSEIKSDFEKKRLPVAVDLFKRHKLSLTKSAYVAGVSTETFKEHLLERKIYPYELDEEKYKELLRIIENIT